MHGQFLQPQKQASGGSNLKLPALITPNDRVGDLCIDPGVSGADNQSPQIQGYLGGFSFINLSHL